MPFSEKFSILEPVCFPNPMMAPKTNKVQPGPWSWRLWRKNQQIQKLEEKIPKCNENGEKHCQLSQYLLPNYLNISLILRVWTELMFFFFLSSFPTTFFFRQPRCVQTPAPPLWKIGPIFFSSSAQNEIVYSSKNHPMQFFVCHSLSLSACY